MTGLVRRPEIYRRDAGASAGPLHGTTNDVIDSAEPAGNLHIANPGDDTSWGTGYISRFVCERGDLMLRNAISCVGTEIFTGEIQRNLRCAKFSASATR